MDKLEMRALVNKLNKYIEAYDAGIPLISDKEWDELYFKLVEAEKEIGTVLANSPTQSIHFQTVSKLNKVKHNHLMLSLNKTKDISIIQSFVEDKDWIAMCKMDGLTCSLKYNNGKLISAETRGNGEIGEDILHNALCVKSIPHHIPFKDELIVDGEIICTYNNFKPFSEQYKNPRNFASGSIRLLDSKECFNRNLDFIAWDVITDFNEQTLSAKLFILQSYGFTVVPRIIKDNSITIEDAINELQIKAKELSYPIDGIVFKYDWVTDYNAAGRTDHHFKGGMAYKFYDETYSTNLKYIDWTMGKTGILSPVAVFNPVDIDGTTVERASLHNISIMQETMGIPYEGEALEIFKSNQIIPQVYSAEKKNDIIPLEIPKICPICGQPTEIKKDGIAQILYCSNPNCEGKFLNQLDHFCGKKGLDIKGLSKATLSKLIDWNWVSCFKDIYRLDEHQKEWIQKPGFGGKSVQNILNAIEESRKPELWRVIAAASIPNIGGVASKELANYFKTYANFRKAVEDNFDFTQLEDFGEVANYDILNFNYTNIDDVVSYAFEIQDAAAAPQEMSLDKVQFCITGKLQHFKNRDELKAKIESLGGKVTGSVSSKTNYLINNDVNSTSGKNKTAKSLNVPIISEDDFLQMVSSN